MKIGIIGALGKEIEGLKNKLQDLSVKTISKQTYYFGKLYGHECCISISGIGKVNMAVCTQTMILEFKPDLMINTGIAGGLDECLRVGDLVVGESTIQHDLNTGSLDGSPVGYIAELDMINIPCKRKYVDILFRCGKELNLNTYIGVIATGDQFISSKKQHQYIHDNFKATCVEMEGGAMGQVCALNNVPYVVVRSISDSANDEAINDYTNFANKAANNSIMLLELFLKQI